MANIILLITVVFIAGIWLAGIFNWTLPLLYVLAFMLCIIVSWRIYRNQEQVIWPLAALFLLAGMIRFVHADTISPSDISHFAGQRLIVNGTVTDIPKITPTADHKVKVKYSLMVESAATDHSRTLPASGGMIVSVGQEEDAPIAAYGAKVTVDGQIMHLHGYNNPGMFDNVAAQKRQGITARMAIPAQNIAIRSAGTANKAWEAVLAGWREKIVANMQKVMPAADAAILSGMLFGGYGGISRETVNDFATTGIVHILSVSGTHIAMVAGIVLWLGTRLTLSYRVTAALAAVAITLYSVFCGLTPPVARSVVMGLVGLAAVGLGREKDAPAALAVAVLGMVIYQPALIYDLSFQLSCGATAGLVFLYSQTLRWLTFLPRWGAGVLAATLAAQLGVLPFIAWYFNSLSISSLIANLLIVPIVEAVVVLGLIGALAGVVIQPAGNAIMVACSLLIGLVEQLTSWLAAVPGGKLYMPPIGISAGIIYYLLLVWFYGYLPLRVPAPGEVVKRWPCQVSGILVLVVIAGVTYTWCPRPVYVHFIDVGQGDAILITTPHGRAIMVDTGGLPGDTGTFDVGEQVVLPYLKHYGVLSLDYLFLTHGHQDHAGGAAAIAASLPVKNILLAREEKHTPAVAALLHAKYGQEIIPAYAGQSIIIDGVAINMVYAGDSSASLHVGNETSCVIRASFGKHSFLFTGDLEAKGEAIILASEQPVTSTVLKVGHHGAKTSSTPQFLQHVAPEYAVISVGYGNRFGHPHPETLRRLAEMNVKVFRTDQQGAVVFKTDGDSLTFDSYIK